MENKLKKIIDWLENYKETTNCKGVVLGISGGKDSSVVAMLAKKVWGDNVFGVLMPNGEQADLQDSIDVVNSLDIDYKVVNLAPVYNSILDVIEDNPNDFGMVTSKSKTNIPPRIRMTILYAIAQSIGFRVIGTGNASEAYIGWTTKWGDSAYDFNPIRHLTCTEVIELGQLLCKEFGLDEKFVVKPPSDGLTGKSDEDNFGFTYEVLDSYVSGCNLGVDYETAFKIEQMHLASQHKRTMPLTVE